MFKHPSYYKKLRKRNKSDRVISSCSNSTELAQRAPGPGLKQRDSTGGVPGEADISVTSDKLLDHGPWKKFHGPLTEVLY